MTKYQPPTGVTQIVLLTLATGPATVFEIQKARRLTGDTVSRALARIVQRGWATYTEAPSAWGHRRRYTITEAGREAAMGRNEQEPS